jgi:hypothetical protein
VESPEWRIMDKPILKDLSGDSSTINNIQDSQNIVQRQSCTFQRQATKPEQTLIPEIQSPPLSVVIWYTWEWTSWNKSPWCCLQDIQMPGPAATKQLTELMNYCRWRARAFDMMFEKDGRGAWIKEVSAETGSLCANLFQVVSKCFLSHTLQPLSSCRLQ